MNENEIKTEVEPPDFSAWFKEKEAKPASKPKREKIRSSRKVGEAWCDWNTLETEIEWRIRIADRNRTAINHELIDKLAEDFGEIRDLRCADDVMIEKIDIVGKSNPHFRDLIDLFRRHLLASKNMNRPIRLPHILITGEPGIGKTHILRTIAEAIALPFSVIDAPAQSGGGVFSGTDQTWRNPRVGKIADALIRHQTANQILLLDEIDKIYQHDDAFDTLAPLHSLLEPSTASKWRDECLGLEIDASYLTIVATANSVEHIAPSILDRFIVLNVEKPDPAFVSSVAKSIFDHLTVDFGDWFSGDLDPSIIESLRDETPRSIRKKMAAAMIHAAAENRRFLKSSDFEKSFSSAKKFSIGFIRER